MEPSWWDTVKEFVSDFGWVKGTFTLFFWVAHFWIYRLYSGRLNDRQKQIDELAKENHEYRDRFLAVLDEHYGFEKRPPESISSERLTIGPGRSAETTEQDRKVTEGRSTSKKPDGATKETKKPGKSPKRR